MSRISPKVVGTIAHIATQCLAKTLRMQIEQHPDVDLAKPGIYCFWHTTHFAPIMFVGKKVTNKSAGLVSTSKDGDILATWMKHMGYEAIRGSSSKKAIAGVVKLMQAVKSGYSIGIALDGPRGPRFEAKAGAGFIASKTGVPIIPLGAAYSRKYEFQKSWDKFQLPLPFGKTGIYLGEPILIPENIPIEDVSEQIKSALDHAQDQAQKLISQKA